MYGPGSYAEPSTGTTSTATSLAKSCAPALHEVITQNQVDAEVINHTGRLLHHDVRRRHGDVTREYSTSTPKTHPFSFSRRSQGSPPVRSSRNSLATAGNADAVTVPARVTRR